MYAMLEGVRTFRRTRRWSIKCLSRNTKTQETVSSHDPKIESSILPATLSGYQVVFHVGWRSRVNRVARWPSAAKGSWSGSVFLDPNPWLFYGAGDCD